MRDVATPVPREAPAWASRFMSGGAGLVCLAVLSPGPAGAHEAKPWMPRRHCRGLKESRKPPEFEKSQIWGHREATGPVHGAKSTVQRMSGAVQDVFGGNQGFTMKKTASKTGHVTLQGMSGPTTSYNPVQQVSRLPAWVPVMGVLMIFVVAFWGRIKAFFTGQGKTAGGRWIRDRSLGGKMVFIPDDGPVGKASASTSALPQAPEGTGAYSAYSPLSKAHPPATATGRPSWFVYTPPLPVTPTTQQECRKRAKRILKKLENDKLLGGQDYDVLALIQLYQTCREGAIAVASPSTTTAARETMLRSAVQGTLESVGQSATRSVRPGEFVCGLALALGVSEQRTIVIVHAAVAAHLRSLLLTAAASMRSGNVDRAGTDLGRVISAVQLYPLPASSPEAELVAAAVRGKLTLDETEGVLKQLAVRAPEYMELFTVMLGFDVSLTLPMLQQVVADASKP